MTLPRYIVERSGLVYAIWDTKEHEWTGFEFDDKGQASKKCESINAIENSLS